MYHDLIFLHERESSTRWRVIHHRRCLCSAPVVPGPTERRTTSSPTISSSTGPPVVAPGKLGRVVLPLSRSTAVFIEPSGDWAQGDCGGSCLCAFSLPGPRRSPRRFAGVLDHFYPNIRCRREDVNGGAGGAGLGRQTEMNTASEIGVPP